MTDEKIDPKNVWEKQGWSFRGTGSKKKGPSGYSLSSGEGAFCFESQIRPAGPPLFIEAKSIFYQGNPVTGLNDSGVLVLWGLPWDFRDPSIEGLKELTETYQRLLAEVKSPRKVKRSERQVPPSSWPATETRESLNKRLFKENLSNQIKTQTVQMAINLGLLGR